MKVENIRMKQIQIMNEIHNKIKNMNMLYNVWGSVLPLWSDSLCFVQKHVQEMLCWHVQKDFSEHSLCLYIYIYTPWASIETPWASESRGNAQLSFTLSPL